MRNYTAAGAYAQGPIIYQRDATASTPNKRKSEEDTKGDKKEERIMQISRKYLHVPEETYTRLIRFRRCHISQIDSNQRSSRRSNTNRYSMGVSPQETIQEGWKPYKTLNGMLVNTKEREIRHGTLNLQQYELRIACGLRVKPLD